jgi:hypothetical protein
MTGSVALDVVIGLVFIYLLYSLLATMLCEIIALHLGLRARNLQSAVQRMLEDSPQTSEVKIIAFFKHIGNSIANLFGAEEGPGTCVFFRLPVIKYLARNTFYSKPSYITRQNFSKAIIEIFRKYGHGEEDLEKIQNVLKGALTYPGILREIKEEILKGTTKDPARPETPIDYVAIRKIITKKVEADSNTELLDTAQKKLLDRINKFLETDQSEKNDKAVIYKIDEMLNLFGQETRNHLLSLLKDSNNDLQKFRFHLEQWFDDTMDRASGWYKQKIQFVLLLIGLGLAVCFNANTFIIIKKLSVDTDARDKLVQMASDYVKDPANSLPEKLSKFSSSDSLQIDTMKKERLEALEKIQAKLQKEMDNANSLLGLGWADLPDSLTLMDLTKKDSLQKLTEEGLVEYTPINLGATSTGDSVKFLIHTGVAKNGILATLTEQNKLIVSDDVYLGYKANATKIAVDNSWWGYFQYVMGNLFSSDFLGYLLTALAISLGAPFWFDMLNKLMKVRGALKEPTKTEAGGAPVSSSISDPAHPINRKG